MHPIGARLSLIVAAAFLVSGLPIAAQDLDPAAAQQVNDVLRLKASLTPAQQKISSDLIFGSMGARNQALPSVPQEFFHRLQTDSQGRVLIDIRTNSLAPAVSRVQALGGQVLFSSARYSSVRAKMPLLQIETLAEDASVRWIRRAAQASVNSAGRAMPRNLHLSPFVGSVTTQGYVSHEANKVVQMAIDGSGVKVGVISNSASAARVTALIASGDLPADTVVLPGQAGAPGQDDEGTAMMEIVHDMAPGAKLFFASGFYGEASFAENIRALRFNYHCDIIVDDVSYYDEPAFQDGSIAQAVNDVVAAGALYFSSAANSGNLSHKTSGTWEGDFKDGGDAGKVIDGALGQPVRIHNFSASGSQLYDNITGVGNAYILQWSDPSDHSSNDYDLFDFDTTGTRMKGASTNTQNGTQDPVEQLVFPDCDPQNPVQDYCPAKGDRLVIVKADSAAPRALHLDTERGRLSVATNGATFGHNAGLNTVSMAATYWNSANIGTQPFTGFANSTETFSSDGPRKIFYKPNGTPITPNNFLFRTGGGQTLQKPDLTAADGNFSRTPGFTPFYGTSSAAPHAAGIAALVKSANPKQSNSQVRSVMVGTALDTMAVGPDRDAGYGITMALQAVEAAIGR